MRPAIAEWLFALLGLLALYGPTVANLWRTQWQFDDQAHGLIIFVVSLWLIYRKWETVLATRQQPMAKVGAVVFIFGLLCYVLGRSQNVIQLEAGSMIPVIAGLLLCLQGAAALKLLWFPLFFLVFMIPLPGAVVQALTIPLKIAVSNVAEWLLYGLGYPVARSGVVLTIGQYQLLVADACAGLNSIFTLEALGLLYLNITNHESVSRNSLLALLIIPISFCANIIRVITLVLITYYFGEVAGQGFAHNMAGMILFIIGLILILGMDYLLGRFIFDTPHPLPEAVR